MKSLFLVAAFLLGAIAPPAFSMESNALSAAERADGWQPLFDGTSLAGWQEPGNAAAPKGWKASDGAIVRVAKSGNLFTTGEYGDFEFTCEWKIPQGANSGVLYRLAMPEDPHNRTGPEYQICDDDLFATHEGHYTAKNHLGALYDLVAPQREAGLPVGQWNRTRIAIVGWRIAYWLNGQKLLETDLGSPDGRALIAHSKFSAMPKYATLARGHLALQNHTGTVWFRNLKIREITALPEN